MKNLFISPPSFFGMFFFPWSENVHSPFDPITIFLSAFTSIPSVFFKNISKKHAKNTYIYLYYFQLIMFLIRKNPSNFLDNIQ